MFQHLFAEAQHVEIEDMRVATILPPMLRKEVRKPQRKVAAVYLFIIRADRIIRHDKAALHNVNEVGLRVSFQHLEQTAYFERIVKSGTITCVIVSVKLPLCVSMPYKP